MPVPSTSTELLDLVRKSGLVEPARLDAYLHEMQSIASLPDEARKLAGLLVRDGLLTYFQSGQILLGKWRGFSIGRYRVLERLGSGGMGNVYLCEHVVMRRRVAIKVLPTELARNPEYVTRFQREAQAVAALDHPNIVRAHDVAEEGSLHYLVMEYVDGVSFQEIVQKTGPLNPLRAAHYIRQAAFGLEHAHEAGLVHRDIKPSNLLVTRAGQVKILDMGLALFFRDRANTLTGELDDKSIVGTADYLAPEQAINSHGVDIRADIYSLGATFHFLVTGKAPFGPGTVAQKLIWHQMRPVRPIREARPDMPEELGAVLHRMLAKAPDERYQTPAELIDALEPWTRIPIAPPAEEELMRLSPAALGSGSTSHSHPSRSSIHSKRGTSSTVSGRGAETPTPIARRTEPATDFLPGIKAEEEDGGFWGQRSSSEGRNNVPLSPPS